jgi:hypothetical protein
MADGYSPDEKKWLFHDAAATAYRLPRVKERHGHD